jgi:tellurite resistance protein TerC
VIASLLKKLTYLKFSLIFILTFVGAKLIVQHHVHIPSWVSLVVVGAAISVGVMASLWAAGFRRNEDREPR